MLLPSIHYGEYAISVSLTGNTIGQRLAEITEDTRFGKSETQSQIEGHAHLSPITYQVCRRHKSCSLMVA